MGSYKETTLLWGFCPKCFFGKVSVTVSIFHKSMLRCRNIWASAWIGKTDILWLLKQNPAWLNNCSQIFKVGIRNHKSRYSDGDPCLSSLCFLKGWSAKDISQLLLLDSWFCLGNFFRCLTDCSSEGINESAFPCWILVTADSKYLSTTIFASAANVSLTTGYAFEILSKSNLVSVSVVVSFCKAFQIDSISFSSWQIKSLSFF